VAYEVAVRTLCELTAKRGDLDIRFTPSPSATEGIAGHRVIASRRGSSFQTELTLAGDYGPLHIRGRADGYDPEENRLEEFKTYRGDLGRMPENHRALHWAQLRIYGWLLCRQKGLSRLKLALVYFDVATERESVLVEERSDDVGSEPGIVVRLDVGGKRLTVLGVGDPEHGVVANSRQFEQCRLDLGGIDVHATRDHHVVAAVVEIQKAVVVDIPDVAARDQSRSARSLALFVVAVVGEVRVAVHPQVDVARGARPDKIAQLLDGISNVSGTVDTNLKLLGNKPGQLIDSTGKVVHVLYAGRANTPQLIDSLIGFFAGIKQIIRVDGPQSTKLAQVYNYIAPLDICQTFVDLCGTPKGATG